MDKEKLLSYSESLIFSGLGKVVSRSVRILVVIIIVRTLPKEDYGIYKLLLSSANIIEVVTSIGVPSILKRYIPKYKNKNLRHLRSIVTKGVVARAAMLILVIITCLLFFDRIGKFLNIEQYYRYFAIFSAGVFGMIMFKSLKTVLNAHLKQKITYSTVAASEIVKGVLVSIALAAGFGLTGLLVAESIVFVGGLIILLYFVYEYTLQRSINFERSKIPLDVKKYGGYGFINNMGSFLMATSIDNIIIAKYLGTKSVAVYNLATLIPNRIRKFMPTKILRDVVEPAIYEKYEIGDSESILNDVFRLLTKLNFILLIPVFIAISLFGSDILRITFGDSYTDTYPYLVVLSAFFFVKMLPIGYITRAKEALHINAISKILSVYNLLLSIHLVQVIGLWGVVLATGSAQLIKTIYMYVHASRHTVLSIPFVSLAKVVLFSGSTFLLIKSFGSIITYNYFTIPIVIIIGFIVSLLSSTKSNCLSPEEKNFIGRLVSSVTNENKKAMKIYRIAT